MPRIRTLAGLAVPAAVVRSGKYRPNAFAAMSDGLVAADVRLRRERVHRLGARQRPRDRVEADRGDAGLGELGHELRVEERLEQRR